MTKALRWVACSLYFVFQASVIVNAQSTDQAFPTALTESQAAGVIKARDVGDPRVTTYYFTFNARQGDLFVNVVTKNLSGSVDIFTTDGMRPLANILVYADVAQNETGRVIYLRKPEKLILRVQGRSPNDDAAEFQIKFAGGFEAAKPTADEPPVPKVTDVGENNSGIIVNSVGTIIAVKPKPTPTPKAVAAETAKAEKDEEEPRKAAEEKPANDEPVAVETEKPAETPANETAKVPAKETVSEAAKTRPSRRRSPPGRKAVKAKTDQNAANPAGNEAKAETAKDDKTTEPTEAGSRGKPAVVITDTTPKAADEANRPPAPRADPLANVRLVIVFKDGRKVERPMTDILRFTADQKTLTVISTNGRVSRFPILDVASVTIQ